jgi:glycosyltransferase involved in cell wall biosynthesis
VAAYTDPRIHYLKNETNSGAALSRNRALREAKGRWIAFLDSDDLWLPEKLEKQIAFMEEEQVAFSYTNYEEIDEASEKLGVFVTGPYRITKTGMNNYCFPGCLTVMYDAEVVGTVQIADIKKNNDYAMWLKVIRKENCYLLNETLALYRKRAGSISNHGYTKLIKWHYKLFREAEGKNPVSAAVHTVRNLVFGVYKKCRYVKKTK